MCFVVTTFISSKGLTNLIQLTFLFLEKLFSTNPFYPYIQWYVISN